MSNTLFKHPKHIPLSPNQKTFIHDLEYKKADYFVFGINTYTDSIIENFSLAGIIDDYTHEKTYKEIPIYKLNNIPKQARVIVASGGNILTAMKKVKELNVRCEHYFTLVNSFPDKLKPVVFNEGFNTHFNQHSKEFEWVFNLLSDTYSKQIFQKLVDLRYSLNLEYADGFSNREKEQYFEPFLTQTTGNEVFVDVGCFDGFTSKSFSLRYVKYKKIIAFEPDPDNFIICKNELSNIPFVTLLPFGLNSKKEVLYFTSFGSGSSIQKTGNIEIQTDTLDSLITEIPTIIKMDIEGFEIQALLGAKETIINHRPSLAISIYHKPEDFWKIPKLILEWVPSYSVYIRHYTESIYETIMYFIPTTDK